MNILFNSKDYINLKIYILILFFLLFFIYIILHYFNFSKLTYEYIKKFPKILLHDHLDGSIRPSTMIDISKELNLPLPSFNPLNLQKWFASKENSGSLKNFLQPFDIILPLLQRKKDLKRLAEESFLDLAKDNVIYAELRILPDAHIKGGLKMTQVIDSILKGFKNAKNKLPLNHNILVNLILCANRSGNNSLEIAKLVQKYKNKGVVGFDLVGLENDNLASNHSITFDYLQKNNIPYIIHAGEESLKNLKDALALNPLRIGHGIKIIDDIKGDVSNYIIENGIHLELCPSSNIRTGLFKDLESHPFKKLINLGFNISINTDDRTLISKTLSDEIFDLNLTKDNLLKIMNNAINKSFTSQKNKFILKEKILDFFNNS